MSKTMAIKRKFEIVGVEESLGGAGPERLFKIKYKAIENKKWTDGTVWMVAKNKEEAKEKSLRRFGGKVWLLYTFNINY